MNLLKQPLFMFTFWLFFVIAVLHNGAIYFYWYWTIPWFDMVMHFLGGVAIGSTFLWLVFWSGIFGRFQKLPFTRGYLLALIASFIVGVLWEIFELKGGIITWPADKIDSYSDLVLDSLGGMTAFINSLRYRKYLNR